MCGRQSDAVSAALQDWTTSAPEGKIAAGVARVIGLDQRRLIGAEKGVARSVETSVMSVEALSATAAAEAVHRLAPKGSVSSVDKLRRRLGRARKRANNEEMKTWGTVSRKRRHDAFVGNQTVKEFFIEVWEADAIQPADSSMADKAMARRSTRAGQTAMAPSIRQLLTECAGHGEAGY